jgi:hypothetical protein
MDEAHLHYETHEEDGVIVVGFSSEPEDTTYRDQDGDPDVQIIIRVVEKGEFVAVFVPQAWSLVGSEHCRAVCEVATRAQAQMKLIRFDLDEDGEYLTPNVEIPLEKAPMCSEQLHRAIGCLMTAINKFDPVIRHAMDTGLVDFDLVPDAPPTSSAEVSGILDIAEAAGGLDAVDRLLGGSSGGEDEVAA